MKQEGGGGKPSQSTRNHIRNVAIAVILDSQCHTLSSKVACGSKLFPAVINGVLSSVVHLALLNR